jgi:2-keto-4-pentenoate hydratase
MAAASIERIARTARQLVDARRHRHMLPALDTAYAPVTIDEAYGVQDEVTRQLALEIVGWKVGFVPGSPAVHAPIYRDDCFESPALLPVSVAGCVIVEGEVAFALGRDLPPRARAYTATEVMDSVDTVCAAIEIGVSRLQNMALAPIEHKVADNVGNGALVRGNGTRAFHALDLAALRVRLYVNDQIVVDRIGGNGAGNPWDALIALVNSAYRKQTLRAGQTIISGTCTDMHEGRAGSTARVVFEQLGEAQVALAPAPTERKHR